MATPREIGPGSRFITVSTGTPLCGCSSGCRNSDIRGYNTYNDRPAGNLGNLLIVLVPSIADQSDEFSEDDAKNGLAYVFTGLFANCIAAFCIAGPLLELPKAQPAAATSGAVTGDETSTTEFATEQQADEQLQVLLQPPLAPV